MMAKEFISFSTRGPGDVGGPGEGARHGLIKVSSSESLESEVSCVSAQSFTLSPRTEMPNPGMRNDSQHFTTPEPPIVGATSPPKSAYRRRGSKEWQGSVRYNELTSCDSVGQTCAEQSDLGRCLDRLESRLERLENCLASSLTDHLTGQLSPFLTMLKEVHQIVKESPSIARSPSNSLKNLSNISPAASTDKIDEPKMLERARVIFDRMDKDKSGTINVDDMMDALRSWGSECKREKVESMMNKMGTDGQLDFDSFVKFVSVMGFKSSIGSEAEVHRSGNLAEGEDHRSTSLVQKTESMKTENGTPSPINLTEFTKVSSKESNKEKNRPPAIDIPSPEARRAPSNTHETYQMNTPPGTSREGSPTLPPENERPGTGPDSPSATASGYPSFNSHPSNSSRESSRSKTSQRMKEAVKAAMRRNGESAACAWIAGCALEELNSPAISPVSPKSLKTPKSPGIMPQLKKSLSTVNSKTSGGEDDLNELAGFFNAVLRRSSTTGSNGVNSAGATQSSLRSALRRLDNELGNLEWMGCLDGGTVAKTLEWPSCVLLWFKMVGVMNFQAPEDEYDSCFGKAFEYCLAFMSRIWQYIIVCICLSYIVAECGILVVTMNTGNDELIVESLIPRFIKIIVAAGAPLLHNSARQFLQQKSSLIYMLQVYLTSFGGYSAWHKFVTRTFFGIILILVVSCSMFQYTYYTSSFADPEGGVYFHSWPLRICHTMLSVFPICVYALNFFLFAIMCMGLQLAVEAFGVRLIEEGTEVELGLNDVMEGWRTLNALVQAVSLATQKSVATSLAACSIIVCLSLYHSFIVQGPSTTWFATSAAISPILSSNFLLMFASGVTQRCARVPVIANALPFAGGVDKMMLVHFMRSSESGYRLFNEPVTRWLVAKVSYMGLMLILFILRNLVSESV